MKLYTKTVCPKCVWVKYEIEQANLEVEIINIDHDIPARERLIEAGLMSLPVLEADGVFLTDTAEIAKRLGV